MNIITKQDLSQSGIAAINNGVTEKQIEIMERGFMVLIFGVDGAEKIYKKMIEEKQNEIENSIFATLFNGDGLLFPGLISMLSIMVSLQLISKGRVSVGRESMSKTATAANLSKREENEVIQALLWELQHVTQTLKKFLATTENNVLSLVVHYSPIINKYQQNLSGKMPVNRY